MFIAAPNPSDQPSTDLAGLGVDLAVNVVDALGPQGTALALAVADVVLLVKVPASRPLHVAAMRAAWRAVLVACRIRVRRPGLKPTKEERKLLRRLQPATWKERAEHRHLDGTLTGRPRLTEAGIVTPLRLDGKWTVAKLRDREESVRALLGCRTSLRMELKHGKRGGWAELVLRTRSAADGDDLKWSPEKRSFGIDTVTGTEVVVPLGERLLIAGMSSAGKSVSSRPLLFDASEGPVNVLVVLDLKQVEGRLWDHRARVESTPAGIVGVVGELVTELHERLGALPKGQAKLTPTARRPRITVVVDEGSEVMLTADRALAGLETLARMGRAACIDLWWMTQKPTIGDGIPKQIAPQLAVRICLAVSTAGEARVVLGEDAQQKGWDADQLPKPGVALIRDGKRKPNPVKVRHMTDKQVIELPEQPIWRRDDQDHDDQAPTLVLPRPLSMVKAEPDSETRVLHALAGGAGRVPELAERTGLSVATVKRALQGLLDAGKAHRADRGRYAVTA